jgi:hypothetical protein
MTKLLPFVFSTCNRFVAITVYPAIRGGTCCEYGTVSASPFRIIWLSVLRFQAGGAAPY